MLSSSHGHLRTNKKHFYFLSKTQRKNAALCTGHRRNTKLLRLAKYLAFITTPFLAPKLLSAKRASSGERWLRNSLWLKTFSEEKWPTSTVSAPGILTNQERARQECEMSFGWRLPVERVSSGEKSCRCKRKSKPESVLVAGLLDLDSLIYFRA